MESTVSSILRESDSARRKLLVEIEKAMDYHIISYIANPNASPNFIDHNDSIFLNDVLESVGKTDKLALIIDSPGGEPNNAEKLAKMCRDFCEDFYVIVPNSAKSAATMIALASDTIYMGYLSEIGPIDPQIRVISPYGQITFIPAQSVIDSVDFLDRSLKGGLDPRAAISLIQRIDPIMLDMANKAIEFSRRFAEQWLSRHMLKGSPKKAKSIAKTLSDNRRWLSHGKRIGIEEAMDIGLKIESIDRESELWKSLWEYYCRAIIHMNNTGSIKLYESSKLTLHFNVTKQKAPSAGSSNQ